MKKIKISCTVPIKTYQLLISLMGENDVSSFFAQLHEKTVHEQIYLKKAYEEAEEDPDRKKVIEDWSLLEGQ